MPLYIQLYSIDLWPLVCRLLIFLLIAQDWAVFSIRKHIQVLSSKPQSVLSARQCKSHGSPCFLYCVIFRNIHMVLFISLLFFYKFIAVPFFDQMELLVRGDILHF